MTDARSRVLIYTRKGCHLCEAAREMLQRHGLRPEMIDIDEDPQLRELYDVSVPVVVIGGKVRFRGHVNEILLRRLLREEGHATKERGCDN